MFGFPATSDLSCMASSLEGCVSLFASSAGYHLTVVCISSRLPRFVVGLCFVSDWIWKVNLITPTSQGHTFEWVSPFSYHILHSLLANPCLVHRPAGNGLLGLKTGSSRHASCHLRIWGILWYPVDDRLLLHDDNEKLQEIFHFTQNWDDLHQFNTHPKTCAFGTNLEIHNIKWNDGEVVARCNENIVYLGIPLPFLNLKRSELFAPMISKLCVALNKVAKARIPFHQASTVIILKVAPSLAYAAMVARPTKQQVTQLRGPIYMACADRHFATHDAQALLLHKTHLHDPDAIMIYASLCGWRRALRMTQIQQWVRQHWATASRRKAVGKGPLNLLYNDLQYLQCTLNLDHLSIVKNSTNEAISLLEPNKKKFQHFVRERIREVFAARLQSKHARWDGISKIDLSKTTQLFRSMHPQAYGRTALMRMLTNSHATPYRLFKQNIVPTPACPYCSCESADILHIAYQCPRMQYVRDTWDEVTHTWAAWPACAQHCLVACTDMPQHVLHKWHIIQNDVAKLLEVWMDFRRNASLVQSVTAESHSIDISQANAQQDRDGTVSHAVVERHAVLVQRNTTFPTKTELIDLEWSPPTSTWAFHKWGASAKDYAALFSFWIKWTTQPFEGAVPCSNWTLVFYIFVQMGGHLAPFVRRCPNLGTVIWKFRNLSLALLKNAWPENPPYDAYGFGCSSEKHWCMRMPPAKEFPGAFFLAMPWDVREVCTKLVQKQTQISIRRNLQYKHHLLEVSEFLQQFQPDNPPLILLETINPRWIKRTRRKRALLRWEDTALSYQEQQCVRSVAARPLQFWADLPAADIKARVSPSKSTRRQFNCLQKFFLSIKVALEKHLSQNSQDSLPHLPLPIWDDELPVCRFCGIMLNFVQAPDKIHRRCIHAQLLPCELLRQNLQNCQEVLHQLAAIIARL